MYWGRAFELADDERTIVAPCPACGTPLFPQRKHECIDLGAKLEKAIREEA